MKSDSRRTEVTVEMDETGKGLILVQRDGHNLYRFDIPAEPLGIDAEPRKRQ